MIITIRHETHYHYSAPLTHMTQQLRLTPREEPHQRLIEWHVQTPREATPFFDVFRNQSHMLTVGGDLRDIILIASGAVAVQPLIDGRLARPSVLSPLIYTVHTPLCGVNDEIAAMAHRFLDMGKTPANMLELAAAIQNAVSYTSGATDSQTTAEQALALGKGVCQDHAHLMLACCHALGVPARYVSGYIDPETTGHAESHAWVDVWLDHDGHAGWVSIDVTHARFASDSHCRLAIGRDYHSAAPVRGVRRGGGTETMTVKVEVNMRAD